MEKSQCSFNQLPFSSLFNTFLTNFAELNDFYATNPFDDHEVEQRANRVNNVQNRKEVVQAFKEYHQFLGIENKQRIAIEKFSDTNALVFVTGQQLGMYGGPLFTIYKTLTTILLARKWEKKLSRPVVPVFWMADEDHDFDEIAGIGIPDSNGLETIRLQETGSGKPVGDELLTDEIQAFNESLKKLNPETDFSDELWNTLESAYQSGQTHAVAFARLMSTWFSKHGVLIAGSNFQPIKAICADALSTSVSEANAIEHTLEAQSVKIEENFHRQVIVGSSNLFYLNDQGKRLKIQKEQHRWEVDGEEWKEAELLADIKKRPERYSPNVFLRPILQDVLLPTIGYVAGPGELAYYGQMKTMYPIFGMEMPVIYPRLSLTLIESGIERIMEKLPFAMCSYNQRIEDLEAAYVEKTNRIDIDQVFKDWVAVIHSSVHTPIAAIKEIDPTLEGTVGKTIAGFENELNKLKGRVFRSVKQQEETQLKRIAKIKAQLFPDGLQERSVSPIYFMNKYGLDIWDNLLQEFEEEDIDVRTHHLLSL